MSRRQRNSFFQCRQFRIEQGGAAMKVTTDACVLGAWPSLDGAERILDIGTGTGLLALFAAQRCNAQIDAVELDATAADQARSNFGASPWAERLRVYQADIRHFEAPASYDRILCNPPFFTASTPNRCARLADARHDDSLPLLELLNACARLLTVQGCAFLLLPAASEDSARQLAMQAGLQLSQRLSIRSSANAAPHRVILGLTREAQPLREQTLTLYTEHPIHTAQAGQLFAPFYQRLRCEDPVLDSGATDGLHR